MRTHTGVLLAIAFAALLAGCTALESEPPTSKSSGDEPSASPSLGPDARAYFDACMDNSDSYVLPSPAPFTPAQLCTALASITLTGLREDLGLGEEFGFTAGINHETGSVELAVLPQFVEVTTEWAEQFDGIVAVVPAPANTLL